MKLTTRHSIHPFRFLMFSFFILILIGGSLLTLPFFSRTHTFTPVLDALFTATSAVCVTGLTTVNTLEHWNTYGQIVILTLIELGGLGIMIIPTTLALMIHKKINLSTQLIVKESMSHFSLSESLHLMTFALKISLIIEAIGAILFSIYFIPEYGWLKGSWYSIFHSISSFCNAGFDLLGDSFMRETIHSGFLLISSLLIISGGLGFLVWHDLLHYKTQKRFSLHSKIALSMTFFLLIGGTLLYGIIDWSQPDLFPKTTMINRWINYFFLSTTARTAGYATIQYAKLPLSAVLLTLILMFIGGTSGSTAGGLKTTTLSVLLIKIRSELKGRSQAEIAGRSLPNALVSRALILFFVSLFTCITFLFLLSLTEFVPQELGIEYLAFDVISAFGTVGITMGLTEQITPYGKVLLMILMYIGRVGISSLLLSLISKKAQYEVPIYYPKEQIIIG